MHSSVEPLARIVQEEISTKLGTDVTLDFRHLMAGDIAGRARSFGSMVQGGMEVERAAALSGLLRQDAA